MISLSTLTFMRLVMLYSDTHVHLTGYNATFAGRVEVFSQGLWGRVTHYGGTWRKKEAAVVCRQLGFPGVVTALSYSAFGDSPGPSLMSRVQCAGTENSLQQCQYRDWVKSPSAKGYQVGVICKTHEFPLNKGDIPIRLQGSSVRNAGRIEVLYAGVWGGISRDYWDMNDAMVACHQLGYQAGAEAALKNGVYGPVIGPVWLTNIQCTGSEANIMECTHDELGNKTELKWARAIASVICKDTALPNGFGMSTLRLRGSHLPNMGRVEVYYAGKWGTIYDSGWDNNDATVACRQLGYSSASLSGYTMFCSNDVLPWFTNFRCKGNETLLDQCVWDFQPGNYGGYYCANVACSDRVIDAGYQLRLKGSPVPHAGRLELLFKGVWGTIYQYDRHFPWLVTGLTSESTRVICRQLGFTDGILSNGWSVFGPGTGPQWFDAYDLRCSGNETNIMNCTLNGQLRLRHYHGPSDVSVVCKPKDPPSNDFQARLMGSSLPTAGTIEILHYDVWGTICGFNIDIFVGHVVCRQLGYSGAEHVFHRTVFGQVKGPMWVWDIQCFGNETNISQCKVKTFDDVFHWWIPGYYRHPSYAGGVICSGVNSSASSTDLNVRLVGASVANVGRVEVFYAGVWGTINSYNWDIHDVHVVCRQLGYPGAISSGYSNQFGFGTGPLWFYNVRCLGNESNFGQCAKDIFGYLNHYGSYVSTASCKLPYQSVITHRNCSSIKCGANGKCINTAVGPICNCTDGVTGLHCQTRTFDPCSSSPCKNGQCFSNDSLYLCACPKGFTGRYCEGKVVNVVDLCQSHPCKNDTSCYSNETHYVCLTNKGEKNSQTTVKSTPRKEEAVSNLYSIIALSVFASLTLPLVAAVVFLIFKIRRLTKQRTKRPNDPSTVFSNKAFRVDSGSEDNETPSTSRNDIDLGLGAASSLGKTIMDSEPVYEDVSRALPPLPPPKNPGEQVPKVTARPKIRTYGDITATEQVGAQYMGLSGRRGENAGQNVTEANSYMALSSVGKSRDNAYSAMRSTSAKAPELRQPGGKGKKKQQRQDMYVNA